MTDKQEKILESALELFAKEGHSSTSTSKIAKKAQVSEGLIFRHFTNKEGLLDAIMVLGEERIKQLFADIVLENNPQLVIDKTLNIARNIARDDEQAYFWKLQYKLKWELELYNEDKTEPIVVALTNAFKKLGYKYPEKEARILMVLIDGLAMRLFLDPNFKMEPMIDFLLSKYKE